MYNDRMTTIPIPDHRLSEIARFAQELHTRISDWVCDLALDTAIEDIGDQGEDALDILEMDISVKLRESLNETLRERFGE